ncbi:MAG TPA: JAB domain-containing protein [Paucimonas sp.]|nr:JAB domain-containing protein [Paucimonas sp.]
MRFRFAGLEREEFHALWLNVRHQVIAAECLFIGTLTSSVVYPREIIKHAYRHNAAAVIFAHNHPSGNARPSAKDLVLTRELKGALRLIDVRLCDHIVVTEHEAVGIETQTMRSGRPRRERRTGTRCGGR